MVQEKILEKLGKIKAHMESAKEIGNEAEAQAFAGMLQQLLLKHKLEMTDIQYTQEMQDEPIIQTSPKTTWVNGKQFYAEYPDIEIVHNRVEWIESLAATVARYYSCTILVSKGYSIIYFVGHKSNVAIVEYLFITMLRSAMKLSDAAAKKFRREYRATYGPGMTPPGYRNSFLDGFILRIAQRLEEERQKFGGANQSMALVRVNKEAIAVSKYMEDNFSKKGAKALRGQRGFNREGYAEGKRVADSMNLTGNAVKEGQSNKQLN